MGGNEPSPATLSRPWLTVARIGNDKRARVRRSTLTPRTTAASAPAGFPAGTAHPSSVPGPSRDTPFTSPKSLERRTLPASSLVPVATVARSPPPPLRVRLAGFTNFEISFPLHFQSFHPPENRNPSRPNATLESAICMHHQNPVAPPASAPSCTSPARRPPHHRGRPNFRLSHLRRPADD